MGGADELPPVARTPDLRWPRPSGRIMPCLLLTLLSFVVVPLRWLVSGLSRSLSWRRTCVLASRACGIGWLRGDVDDNGSQTQLTSAQKKELAQLRRDKRRLELEVEILKRAAAYFARENVLPN